MSSTRSYQSTGHAKKLTPIIDSLSYFDHDPAAWSSLKEQVEELMSGWAAILQTLPDDCAAKQTLLRQRDLCTEALRLQGGLFQSHRQTCVEALKLRPNAQAQIVSNRS